MLATSLLFRKTPPSSPYCWASLAESFVIFTQRPDWPAKLPTALRPVPVTNAAWVARDLHSRDTSPCSVSHGSSSAPSPRSSTPVVLDHGDVGTGWRYFAHGDEFTVGRHIRPVTGIGLRTGALGARSRIKYRLDDLEPCPLG